LVGLQVLQETLWVSLPRILLFLSGKLQFLEVFRLKTARFAPRGAKLQGISKNQPGF
jgi:hypothetical protein